MPERLRLPVATPQPLAGGAQEKNTFCLAMGDRGTVGHHIGELDHYSTLRACRKGTSHFDRRARV